LLTISFCNRTSVNSARVTLTKIIIIMVMIIEMGGKTWTIKLCTQLGLSDNISNNDDNLRIFSYHKHENVQKRGCPPGRRSERPLAVADINNQHVAVHSSGDLWNLSSTAVALPTLVLCGWSCLDPASRRRHPKISTASGGSKIQIALLLFYYVLN
jgi:hypothetical protein